jgi:hypothetical protein
MPGSKGSWKAHPFRRDSGRSGSGVIQRAPERGRAQAHSFVLYVPGMCETPGMQDILAGQVDVGLEACVVMDEIEVTTLASGDFQFDDLGRGAVDVGKTQIVQLLSEDKERLKWRHAERSLSPGSALALQSIPDVACGWPRL